MKLRSRPTLALILSLSLVTGCVRYEPAPIDSSKSLDAFEARGLSDPGLLAYVHASEGIPAAVPLTWDLNALTLAAFYFHPDVEIARAKMALAEAGETTAAQSPNPTVSFTPQYGTNPEPGYGPWTLGFGLDLPIETAGKRSHRIAEARALTDSARLALAETRWQVRSRLRAALLDHLLTVKEIQLLRDEEKSRGETVRLLERRLAAGEVSVVELNLAQIDHDSSLLALRTAEGRIDQTLAVLAAATGVPAKALKEIFFVWPDLSHPPSSGRSSYEASDRTAILNRLDVRRTLDDYIASDARLRLEIAKQYPDIHLAPDYSYNSGQNTYALGVTLELPILNHNQGPIAEAAAKRKEAAALFTSVQTQAVAQTEQAWAGYRAALAVLVEADRLLSLQEKKLLTVERSVKVGEEDLLTLASARVEKAVATRSHFDALRKTQASLGALEDAVQRPFESIAASASGSVETRPATRTDDDK